MDMREEISKAIVSYMVAGMLIGANLTVGFFNEDSLIHLVLTVISIMLALIGYRSHQRVHTELSARKHEDR